MNISIKNFEDIEKMRIAGKLAAEVLEMITPFVKPGVSTGELDKLCYDHIVNVQNAIPANVGYKGYEKTICSSINQVICHGIPNSEKFLKDGDILNIDLFGNKFQKEIKTVEKSNSKDIAPAESGSVATISIVVIAEPPDTVPKVPAAVEKTGCASTLI